jgi:hypothetical protein
MADKKQWNVRVEDQLIDRLNRLAPKVGYSSANELAGDMLNLFAELMADIMIEIREIERDTIQRRREELLAKIRQVQESGTDREDDRGRSRRK